jgi:hypothetical protein
MARLVSPSTGEKGKVADYGQGDRKLVFSYSETAFFTVTFGKSL